MKALVKTNSFVAPTAELPEVQQDVIGNVSMRKLSKIKVSAEQARTIFDESALQELAASIKKHGILQPLVIRSNGMLVAGERRFRASKIAGLVEVPVIVRDVEDSKESYLLGLIENVQRADLNPMEEAAAYAKLNTDYGMTQEQIAADLGKKRTRITKVLGLLDLPEDVQAMVRNGQIDWSKALDLKSAPAEVVTEIAQAATENLPKQAVNAMVNKAKAVYTGTVEAPKPATITEVEAVIFKELNRNAVGSIDNRIKWLKANSDMERYTKICIKVIDAAVFSAAYQNVMTDLDNMKASAKVSQPVVSSMPNPDMPPAWATDESMDIPFAEGIRQQPDNSEVIALNGSTGGFSAASVVDKFEVGEDELTIMRRALRQIAAYALGRENEHVARLIEIASVALGD